MKLHIPLLTLLSMCLATNSQAQLTIPDKKHENIGLTYPISSNGQHAGSLTNCFSLNALIGLSNGETGLSIAGLSNLIVDSSKGLQIAGLVNLTGQHSGGIQLAGLANYSGHNTGTQIAGLANIVCSNSTGLQLSGLINKAGNSGTQVAGLINVAKKVKGIQIAGLINIADSSDYPIAIFNFIKHGEKTISLTTDETLTTLVTFRSGGKYLYGIAGTGYNHKGQKSLNAWEAGLGAHLITKQRFRLSVEIVNIGLTDYKQSDWMKSSARLLPSYQLGSRFHIFAGPSFNYLHTKRGVEEDLVDHYLWSQTNTHSFNGLFLGATGGISITL